MSETKICNRCGQEKESAVFLHSLQWFVCDECRKDDNTLHLGHDSTIKSMEYQSPTKSPWGSNNAK